MEYSTDQKIACIEREIRLRRQAYPKWVAQSRMSQAIAERELGCMAAILADYQAQLPVEPDLFGKGGAR